MDKSEGRLGAFFNTPKLLVPFGKTLDWKPKSQAHNLKVAGSHPAHATNTNTITVIKHSYPLDVEMCEYYLRLRLFAQGVFDAGCYFTRQEIGYER